GDGRGVGGGLRQRTRTGHRGEVVEAHLDADRAPVPLMRAEALAQLAGHARERVPQLALVAEVAIERALARLRDDLARGADLGAGFKPRAAAQVGPQARAEALDQRLL